MPPRPRLLAAVELGEHLHLLVSRDAEPVIPHRDEHLPVALMQADLDA
jgi:hypothetical protein